jgi:hypothetical protein
MALTRTAETAILAGSYRRAAAAVIEVLGLLGDQASRPWVADALEMAAIVMQTHQDGETAVELLQAAEALRVASGERAGGTLSIAGMVPLVIDRITAARGPLAATPHSDPVPPRGHRRSAGEDHSSPIYSCDPMNQVVEPGSDGDVCKGHALSRPLAYRADWSAPSGRRDEQTPMSAA